MASFIAYLYYSLHGTVLVRHGEFGLSLSFYFRQISTKLILTPYNLGSEQKRCFMSYGFVIFDHLKKLGRIVLFGIQFMAKSNL